MTALHKNRPWIFAVLVAVFFICARAGSIAHAASYGSAPHNHDGKICVLSVLGSEDDELDDLALPPAKISLERPVSSRAAFMEMAVINVHKTAIKTAARSPPAR